MKKFLMLATLLVSLAPGAFARSKGRGTLGSLNALQCKPVLDDSTATFNITGTWTGTITFQGINNEVESDATYVSTKALLIGTRRRTTTTTTNGTYLVQVASFTQVCVKMTAYTSGTATVTTIISEGVHDVPETTNVATVETIACNSGTSPCSIAASATTILNNNNDRHSVCLQHVGAAGSANVSFTIGSTTPSLTVYNFLLGPQGGSIPSSICFSGSTVFGDQIQAFGGTNASIAVFAY